MGRVKPRLNHCCKSVRGLMALTVLLACGSVVAAPTGKEQRAYNAAVEALRDGAWSRAEFEFQEFVRKYPKSELLADAVLYQAQALFQQTNSGGAVELLSSNLDRAGFLADEYLFWLAEARFQAGDYAAAAASYARVVNEFPASGRCVEACVSQAAAQVKLGNWPVVIEVLGGTSGVFAEAARATPMPETIVRGLLLLAEAYLAQENPSAAESTLARMAGQPLSPALDWRRNYLTYRALLAENRIEDALQVTTNLVAAAGDLKSDNRGQLLGESFLFQSRMLERLGRLDAAAAVLQPNLTEGVPAGPQRESLLKLADLSLARGRTAEARQTLERFLAQYPKAAAADMAMLALGELELKLGVTTGDSVVGPAPATNHLQQATGHFDALINGYPDSPLVGRALLDKGWCLWLQEDVTNSLPLFESAAQRLPFSMDQAVARFKWADAQMAVGDVDGAMFNYGRLITQYATLAQAREQLFELALYQQTRAALRATNMDVATSALQKIFDWYPNGLLGDHSLLLVGQGMVTGHGLAEKPDPARARKLFEDYAKHQPSALEPEIQLAVARSYEQEHDWASAVSRYDDWLKNHSNNVQRPRAEYFRAWANFQDGRETNALVQFTNFVSQYSSNDLAPAAQLWVADFYFRKGDFVAAEKNYKQLFQTWPRSRLALDACMMAGRAAAGWQNYLGAIEYFTNLTSRLDCPSDLKAEALFAYGDALRLGGSGTNQQANLTLAVGVYNQICQLYPTNEQCALAWGLRGECYFQMGAQDPLFYEAATNAFQQVLLSPWAGPAARSQAQIGLGKVLEKLAERKTGGEQAALQQQALDAYLDVVYEKNLRDGEERDAFWSRKAGWEALRLAGALQQWDLAENLGRRLEKLFPALASDLERRLARLQEQKNAASEKNQ